MKIIQILCFIAVPLIVVNIVISIVSIMTIREQNLEYITNSISLYQTDTAAKIKSIEHFIQWSVVNEPLVEKMEEADSIIDRTDSVNAFRTRVYDTQIATGFEYQYFMYLENQDLFFNASPLQITYSEYLSIKDFIIDLVDSGTSATNNSSWQSIERNNQVYLYYLITYNNRTFVTFISINDLLSPLRDLNLGKNGSLILTDLNGSFLTDSSQLEDTAKYHNHSLFYNQLTFGGKQEHLPFYLNIYVDNFSHYGHLLLIQLLVIITALALCVTLSGFILYMYQKVIKPIHTFSTNLSNINEQGDFLNLQDSNIQELEQTNLQFKNLMHEIKKLKIRIYEKELDKKRFEINFLQNQIRPHFYLNCLTTISSMAQLGNYDDIQSMVLFTSRYLRYLFQTDKDMVRIEYELMHIQAYLDIQSLRYGTVFEYHCHVAPEDNDALIPPLMLITFVENIVKHGIAVDGHMKIDITITKKYKNQKIYLLIEIQDSGQGFPEDILEKLAAGEPINTKTQSHIGLTNNMQRLALLYETDYQITFSNAPCSGANVTLLIPYCSQEEN